MGQSDLLKPLLLPSADVEGPCGSVALSTCNKFRCVSFLKLSFSRSCSCKGTFTEELVLLVHNEECRWAPPKGFQANQSENPAFRVRQLCRTESGLHVWVLDTDRHPSCSAVVPWTSLPH